MAKYWGKRIFTHGEFHRSGSKTKEGDKKEREKKKERRKRERETERW